MATKKKQIMIMVFVAMVALGSNLTHTEENTFKSNASDDDIYRVVKMCLDLQYSIRPDWVPSDTTKAAFCITKAVSTWGDGPVEKMIALVLNRPYSMDYMSLLTDKEKHLIKEASSVGVKDMKSRTAELLIANANIEAAKNSK